MYFLLDFETNLAIEQGLLNTNSSDLPHFCRGTTCSLSSLASAAAGKLRQFWQAQQQRIQVPDPAALQIDSAWAPTNNEVPNELPTPGSRSDTWGGFEPMAKKNGDFWNMPSIYTGWW